MKWFGVVNGRGSLSSVYEHLGLAQSALNCREDRAECAVVEVEVDIVGYWQAKAPAKKGRKKG